MDFLLDTKTAARQLRVSPRTLERQRVSGLGPLYLKLGKLIRYRQSDLEDWLMTKTRLSTSSAVADRHPNSK